MGKTIFAAVVSAVLASIVTVLVMSSFQQDRATADAETRRLADETARVERERLDRRVAEIEKRAAPPARAERRAASEPPGAAVPPPPLAPDGTPYVSRAEMESYAKKRGAELVQQAMAMPPAKIAEKKSLEDIAREQGLSAGEEANIRNILRESEEEMVRSLFGDKPLDDVKREVIEAKDDPDKQGALLQTMIQNGMANLGKIATAEGRMKKRVEGVLGADRTKAFLAVPRKPVIAPELEDVVLKAGIDSK